MSEKPPRLWDRIKGWLRFWLASAAIRYCGPELIYWIDSERWEEYMADDMGVVSEYDYAPGHVHDIGDMLP